VDGTTGDKPDNGLSPVSSTGAQEYPNYSQATKKEEVAPQKSSAEPLCDSAIAHTGFVPGRSQPIQITSYPDPKSGQLVYHVAGTLRPGGKQQHTNYRSSEDALAKQKEWEEIRIRGLAATRPKLTALTYDDLKEAEAALALAKSTGMTLLDAVRLAAEIGPTKAKEAAKALQLAEGEPFSLPDAVKFAISQRFQTTNLVEITLEEALCKYQAMKEDHLSASHFERSGQRARSFAKFIGKKSVREITAADARAWVEATAKPDGVLHSKGTWNKCVTDISTVFRYFEKQKWCTSNPFADIERFSRKSMGAKERGRLEPPECAALMAYVEEHHPKWCCYFTLALLLGIRPDLRNGEIRELARCIERDGATPYYSNGQIHLSAEITKECVPREVKVSPNAAAWLKKYPLSAKNVCPGDYNDDDFRAIRKKFAIPHDGLRHTAISAFMSSGNSYDLAADQFGNSEQIIRTHYLKRMSKEDADAFFQIMPSGPR
jgi:hypothetical protein